MHRELVAFRVDDEGSLDYFEMCCEDPTCDWYIGHEFPDKSFTQLPLDRGTYGDQHCILSKGARDRVQSEDGQHGGHPINQQSDLFLDSGI